MTVEFVGVFRQVEARVVLMPVDLFAGRHDAIALLRGIECLLRVAAAKAVGEVLFTGQVCAPWRLAIGAVLERSQDLFTLGVGAGLE
ncbi:hypothetical protein D3C78_1568360 [compost metagenome]